MLQPDWFYLCPQAPFKRFRDLLSLLTKIKIVLVKTNLDFLKLEQKVGNCIGIFFRETTSFIVFNPFHRFARRVSGREEKTRIFTGS